MKRTILIILAVVLGVYIISLFLPRYVVRYFVWNFADLHDNEKFDNLPVDKGPNTFYFTTSPGNFDFELPPAFSETDRYGSFDEFLEKKKTVAFLAIRNDTTLYENYFFGYDSATVVPSFSVSKSVVSALMGIAIDEGYIYSTSQSITFFLKELPAEFDAIRIEDLLNMRSGIDFDEGYTNPFAEMPKYYYGTDLLSYIKKLKTKEPPDLSYDYISVNTILLGLIIERATNTKLNVYLQERIWEPLGMESDASWSVDSYEHQVFKANCCINAIARDFAKFGRLYLYHGEWNGEQVVPRTWVDRSLSIINDSRDSQGYPYTYQWRVLQNGSFFAKGILGQYIIVIPEKNLIFVRLGKKVADVDWMEFCSQLANQLK